MLLLILVTQTRQFKFLFLLWKTLYLRGEANQLAVLTFNNSPITCLVALKCGSAWELVISVTLTALTGGLGRNEQHPASQLGTWRRDKRRS